MIKFGDMVVVRRGEGVEWFGGRLGWGGVG